MSCCPKPDKTPLDPDREGPSEEDLKRFGDHDDDPYTESASETTNESIKSKPTPMSIAAPAIAAVAVVAFILAIAL